MTPPNPFPTRELPSLRGAEIRSFLVHEAMRDGRPEPRRRPALVASLAAVTVGTLAVGGVVVGSQIGHRPVRLGTAAGPSAPSADPTGNGPGCEGFLRSNGSETDALRYLAAAAPAAYRLTAAWGTVLDSDCPPEAGKQLGVALLQKGSSVIGILRTNLDQAAGDPAMASAVATATAANSTAPPAPTAGTEATVRSTDGIELTTQPDKSVSATWSGGTNSWQVNAVGATDAELLTVARAVKAAGTVPTAGTFGLSGWTRQPLSTAGAGRANWYAEYAAIQPPTDGGVPDQVQFQFSSRSAADQINDALLLATQAHARIDVNGQSVTVVGQKDSGSVWALWEVSPGVTGRVSVTRATDPVATVRAFVGALVHVAADDPRIVPPKSDAEISASASASAQPVAPAAGKGG
ncbi:MAG: hypothetical protein QOI42_438 [Frankiaceae bacterium]|nr:hypothetical protein [Frankiaceae bacterium]